MRKLKQIALYLMYDDGNRIVVRSPERLRKLGLRTKFGYWLMLIGGWIIFGHSKRWQTLINPMWTKEAE